MNDLRNYKDFLTYVNESNGWTLNDVEIDDCMGLNGVITFEITFDNLEGDDEEETEFNLELDFKFFNKIANKILFRNPIPITDINEDEIKIKELISLEKFSNYDLSPFSVKYKQEGWIPNIVPLTMVSNREFLNFISKLFIEIIVMENKVDTSDEGKFKRVMFLVNSHNDAYAAPIDNSVYDYNKRIKVEYTNEYGNECIEIFDFERDFNTLKEDNKNRSKYE